MSWIAVFPGRAGLGDQCAHATLLHGACASCLPAAELGNGLCYHFIAKYRVMQRSLQILYLLAFRSDGEGRKRTSSTCSNESLNTGGTPVTPRRISWRQRIFLRVASPMNKSPSAMQQQGLCVIAEEFPLVSAMDLGRQWKWFVYK